MFFIYLPSALLTGAAAAAFPAIIAICLDLGASPAQAGLVTTAIAAGNMLATLPAGKAVTRFGSRPMLHLSAGLIIAALIAMLTSPVLPVLVVSMLALGAGSGIHTVARITWLSATLPDNKLAEVFSILSAWLRVGLIGGPLLGAGAFLLTENISSPVLVGLVLAATAAVLHLTDRSKVSVHVKPQTRTLMRTMLIQNKDTVLRVGVIHAAVTALRHIKTILIPLTALSLGMDVGQVSLLTAVASVIGFVGIWIGIRLAKATDPVACGAISCAGVSAGLFGMIIASGPAWLVLIVVITEVATGLGAGFLSLMASRAAPPGDPAPMISIFQLVSEASAVVSPAIVMGVIALGSLPSGAAAGAVIGAASTALLIRNQSVQKHLSEL